MATGDYIIPGAQAVTQWGIGFINACGEAALAVLEGVQNGVAPTIAQVQNLARSGVQFGTAPSGTSTLGELQKVAAASGTATTIGSGGSAVLSTINANLQAGKATELGVSNARAFGGSDTNVRGHYVTVVGRATNGNYIVADSNQPAALQGQFVQYSPQQILNAQPFGTLTASGVPNPLSAGEQFTANAIGGGLTQAFGKIGDSFKKSLNISGINDFIWRSLLIGGGMTLIVIGLLVFFSKQEAQVGGAVVEQVGNAAKAGATAAAA